MTKREWILTYFTFWHYGVMKRNSESIPDTVVPPSFVPLFSAAPQPKPRCNNAYLDANLTLPQISDTRPRQRHGGQLVPPQPVGPSSLRSSPFESRDTSRNVSRDASRHGPGNGKGLATYAEDQEPGEPQPTPQAAPAAAGQEETKYGGGGGAAAAAEASAAETAAAMAAAWAGSSASAAGTGDNNNFDGAPAPTEESFSASSSSSAVSRLSPAHQQQQQQRGQTDQQQQQRQQQIREAAATLQAGYAPTTTTTTASATLAPELVVPAGAASGQAPAAGAEVAVATAVGVAVAAAATTGGEAGRRSRPPVGTGVQADPTSHQHKRPVSGVADCCLRVPPDVGERVGVRGSRGGVSGVRLRSIAEDFVFCRSPSLPARDRLATNRQAFSVGALCFSVLRRPCCYLLLS